MKAVEILRKANDIDDELMRAYYRNLVRDWTSAAGTRLAMTQRQDLLFRLARALLGAAVLSGAMIFLFLTTAAGWQ